MAAPNKLKLIYRERKRIFSALYSNGPMSLPEKGVALPPPPVGPVTYGFKSFSNVNAAVTAVGTV